MKSICIDSKDVLGHLGEGSFGDVYKVRDNGNVYALKNYTQNALHSSNLREIDILLRLNHPNVIKVYKAYTKRSENGNGTCSVCLFLDLADSDLETYMENEIPYETKVSILYGLLCGIRYLHANYIIHRDLKPANILMIGNIPKIADFGISTVAHKKHLQYSDIGTLIFRAPELLIAQFDPKNSTYTSAIDMWAIGCIWYILLNGDEFVSLSPDSLAEQLKIISEIELLEQIVEKLGRLPEKYMNKLPRKHQRELRKISLDEEERISLSTTDILYDLFQLEPEKRITADVAIKHSTFDKIKRDCPELVIESFPTIIDLPEQYKSERKELWMKIYNNVNFHDSINDIIFLAIDILDRYATIARNTTITDEYVKAVLELACGVLELSVADYQWSTQKSLEFIRCDIISKLQFRLFRPTVDLGIENIDKTNIALCYINSPVPDEVRLCYNSEDGLKEELHYKAIKYLDEYAKDKDATMDLALAFRHFLDDAVKKGYYINDILTPDEYDKKYGSLLVTLGLRFDP